MRTFTLNGKEYKAHAFDFNLLCELEEVGVSLEDIGTKPMTILRAYVSICIGKGKEYAGTEMQNHVINGGSFDEIMDILGKEIDESDFFQQMGEKKQTTKRVKKVVG